jgi:hypothetical protein
MELINKTINNEAWREYDYNGRVYRITNPVSLHYRPEGTTHRVVDGEGVTHCVPAPGFFGCALRWQGVAGSPAVSF